MAWGRDANGIKDLLDKTANAKDVTSLFVLPSRSITQEDIEQLSQLLQSSSCRLKELYLSGHALNESMLRVLAQSLKSNASLQYLSIGDKNLGDYAVSIISQALIENSNSQVRIWDLVNKSITHRGVCFFQEYPITNQLHVLDLSNNQIGQEGVQILCEALLHPKNSLKELYLAENKLDKEALETLAACIISDAFKLRVLDLASNQFGSASNRLFQALVSNQSIEILRLSKCDISDSQLECISTFLKSTRVLKELQLSDNRITAKGCKFVAKGLEENASLQSLNLSRNECADEGALCLAKAIGNSQHSSLQSLQLSSNQLTFNGIKSLLIDALGITEMHFYDNRLGADVGAIVPALVANQSIVTLGLSGNDLHGDLSAILFDALHAHPSLKVLEMGGNNLNAAAHKALEHLKQQNPLLDVAIDKREEQ